VTPTPTLRVAPLSGLRRHEGVDPLRVERLRERIRAEGIQVNPMVCVEADGNLVVLDGATRTEALRALGLEHAVVQVVDPGQVELETWHHVVRQCAPSDLLELVVSSEGLSLDEDRGAPRIRPASGPTRSVTSEELTPNATLSALVSTYIGRWPVSRVTEADAGVAKSLFHDWAALVELPTLSVNDVMRAALGDDLLPAGITRFLIPGRALRLNFDLSLLEAEGTTAEKQKRLEALIETRSREGRVRRYDETVFIYDD
jgi:hypothetical protein